MDFIERLRGKPNSTKQIVAITTSAVVTLAIFIVWSTVLHFSIPQKNADVTATVANGSDADVNPFSAFWSVVSKGWDGLNNNINNIKKVPAAAGELMNSINEMASTSAVVTSPTQTTKIEKTETVPQNDTFILNNITQ